MFLHFVSHSGNKWIINNILYFYDEYLSKRRIHIKSITSSGVVQLECVISLATFEKWIKCDKQFQWKIVCHPSVACRPMEDDLSSVNARGRLALCLHSEESLFAQWIWHSDEPERHGLIGNNYQQWIWRKKKPGVDSEEWLFFLGAAASGGKTGCGDSNSNCFDSVTFRLNLCCPSVSEHFWKSNRSEPCICSAIGRRRRQRRTSLILGHE